eukprot:CAMPEP_0197524152 /NCGR_PEP_ID=MMETSP1318-20131121/8900_1 /TAXON_ID=552666 /ORGANISM="Partenskyella glossopodia, Strain RCC365" /LENGTH=322 /DNA_ID=CAMNT_0043077035 /DNA_START=158 /DNA_END=1127 /DNA_ORIENTATION=+
MALLQAAQSLENYGRKSQGFPSARPSRGHNTSASPSPPKLSGVSPREDPGFYATNGTGKSDTTGSESSSGSTGKPNGRKRKYTEKHHYADRKAYAAPRRMQRLPTENGIMTNGHVRNAKHYRHSNGSSTSTLSNGTWGRLNGIDSGTKTKAKKTITKNKSKKHASRYNNREIIKQEKIGNGSGSMKNIHSNLKHTLLSDDETSSSGSHKSVGRTEAKLEANLQALSKKGISLEEVAKVPCLHQNICKVSIVEELTKRHICHVCMSEVKIEKVLKASNVTRAQEGWGDSNAIKFTVLVFAEVSSTPEILARYVTAKSARNAFP